MKKGTARKFVLIMLDVANPIQWEFESAGSDGTILFAYDGENFIEFPGSHHGLIDQFAQYTPTNPTVRAKVQIYADDPFPFTNMIDESDDYFIVGGIRVTAPELGDLFTVGESENITWSSAGAEFQSAWQYVQVAR